MLLSMWGLLVFFTLFITRLMIFVRTGSLAMGEHYTIAFRVHCGTICGAYGTAVSFFWGSFIITVRQLIQYSVLYCIFLQYSSIAVS